MSGLLEGLRACEALHEVIVLSVCLECAAALVLHTIAPYEGKYLVLA